MHHLDRRKFLQCSALASASLMLGGASVAATHATKMKLGLVTYQWGKEWSVAELVKNCLATGFEGVELRTGHKHDVDLHLSAEQRAGVAKQFAGSGVAVVGIGSACEYHSPDPAILKKNIQETKDYVLLSQQLGGSGVKVRPNDLPKNVEPEKSIEQIGKSIREVSAFAAEHGQEIRVEVHGPRTSNIQVMHKIMQFADGPGAKVCWNCNKQDLAEPGFETNFKLLQPWLGTVHIHDLTKDDYPWEELFKLLHEFKFQGWTLLEEGRMPPDIIEAMKANKKRWNELARVPA